MKIIKILAAMAGLVFLVSCSHKHKHHEGHHGKKGHGCSSESCKRQKHGHHHKHKHSCSSESCARKKSDKGHSCGCKKVWFVEPKDGDKVSSPVKIKFAVKGMKIAPAGKMMEGTGHHHLIINGTVVEKGKVVPADEKHIHFGKGQTETTVELPKGKHTLTMQFADGAHQSYGEKMSQTITVHVE